MPPASVRSFDTDMILDGLGVDRQGAHTHYEQMYVSSIEPRTRLLHRLYQTLR
jgi:glutamate carboxypeptidase